MTNRLSQSTDPCSTAYFKISGLQFSVPKSHTKRHKNNKSNSNPPSRVPSYSSPDAAILSIQDKTQQRVLCSQMNLLLDGGNIAIVKGPSGSGKSTLLRVLSGLTPMDEGDVTASNMSLASIAGGNGPCMVNWRATIRYVTQYKVDIPGTPRDFIQRLAECREYSKSNMPSNDEMVSQTMAYLLKWSNFEDVQSNNITSYMNSVDVNHPYLDKEWKTLSGGESQRVLLAVSLASKPRVLLLDEATSGLDDKTEKTVEESVVQYVKKYSAVLLWVTHDEDIADRLLSL